MRLVVWIGLGLFVGLLIFASQVPAHALPEFATRTGQQCTTCHVNPAGGGPRTLRGLLWIAQGRPDEVPPLPGSEEEEGATLDGPTLFRKIECARCHGAIGEGGAAPPLNQEELPANELTSILRNGVGAMKGFSPDVLSDEELDVLVEYVQAIGRGEVKAGLVLRKRLLPPPRLTRGPDALAVAEYSEKAPLMFQRYCAGCHMIDGAGSTKGPDLSAVGAYRDAKFLAAVIRDPAEVFERSEMPDFEGLLEPGIIQDLANYLTAQRSADVAPAARPTPTPAPLSFTQDVAPIFKDACAGCHGGLKTYAGLDLRSHDSLMTTGRSRPLIIPGDSEHSLLYLTLVDRAEGVDRMPMSGLLTTRQIQMIQHWIDQGAQRN